MPTYKKYLVQYNLNGNAVMRETEALSFLGATINASTNINHRPSLKGATITSIKEMGNVLA